MTWDGQSNDRTGAKTSPYVQYAIQDDVLLPCKETVRKLAPGFYEVVRTARREFGFRPMTAATDDLILIEGTVADEIFADIDAFLKRRELFRRAGLVHKRGYLLHGPGGTGKTSLGFLIAHHFIGKLDGVAVLAPTPELFYHGVQLLRSVEPGRPSLYLLEEADRVVNNTHCLGILDGALSLEAAIFVAMTNHPGKLPARVKKRPGRFARIVRVDSPPEIVQVQYVTRLAQRAGDDVCRGRASPGGICAALADLQPNMDYLREAFVSHVLLGEDLSSVQDRLRRMKEAADEESDSKIDEQDDWEPDDD